MLIEKAEQHPTEVLVATPGNLLRSASEVHLGVLRVLASLLPGALALLME